MSTQIELGLTGKVDQQATEVNVTKSINAISKVLPSLKLNIDADKSLAQAGVTVKEMTSHANYVILDIRSKMENVLKKKTNIIVIQINVRNVM